MGIGLSSDRTPGHYGSLNVVSIFTRVLTMVAICLICWHSEDILRLFHHILTLYLSFSSQLYKQCNGMAIGSPLSPVIANFPWKTLKRCCLTRQSIWFCYGWRFHNLGSLVPTGWGISSTTWTCPVRTFSSPRDGHIPLMVTDIYRGPADSLVHKEYCKPTHTTLDLNSGSNHHPLNKYSVLFTLVNRATVLCNHDSLLDEPEFLKDTCRQKGYSDQQIWRALDPTMRIAPPTNKPHSATFLFYVRSVLNCISRVLSW